jgi:hypothetical protein
MEHDGNTVDLESRSSIEYLPHDHLRVHTQVASEGSGAALCALGLSETTSAASTHQAPDTTTAILAYHGSETLKDLTRMVMEHSGGSGLVIQNIIGSSLSASAQVDW